MRGCLASGRIAGCGLAAVLSLGAAVGLVFCLRAGMGQGVYFQAKYGMARDSLSEILARAQRVHRFYPHHYLFCIFAAEEGYHHAGSAAGGERSAHLAAAELWCDRGLALNPYKSQLRCLKARLIAMADPRDAMAYWNEFVEWQFWAPYNHLVAVELAVKAGDFESALDSLRWIKGSSYHDAAASLVREAWTRERDSLRGVMQDPGRSVKRPANE